MMLTLTFTQDLLIILLMITMGMLSQYLINKNYKEYLQVPSSGGMTGAEAAKMFLEKNGIYDVNIQPSRGYLQDYYDPRNKVIMLSESNYYGRSISSVSVACHEVGHAIQHAKNYKMLVLRNKLIPITNISNNLSWTLIFLGILFGSLGMVYVGIGFFCILALFQLVTLPVEFNASHRALEFFREGNCMTKDESYGAKKVLNAAAFTYVAALLTSLVQIGRLLLMFHSDDQ